MFDLPFPLRLLLLCFLYPVRAKAGVTVKNLTIDDNDPSIWYSPGWTTSDPSISLDYGGFHHLSDQSSAYAIFNFTGVAVYFLSPLWPYAVGAQLVLDGQSPVVLDLQDSSQPVSSTGGSETASSKILWGATNLSAGNHSLRIEFAQGMAKYLVLDALMYSYIESNSDPLSSSSAAGAALPSSSSTSPTFVPRASSSSSSSQTSTSKTPIIVGVVIAVILALVGIGLVWAFFRYRTRIVSRFPRLFGVIDEEQPEDRDQNGLLNRRTSSVWDGTQVTDSSQRSHTRVTNVTSAPTTVSSPNPAPPPPTSSRPQLPHIITKKLPSLPPLSPVTERETQSAVTVKSRSFLASFTKRNTVAPVVPVNVEKQLSTGTSSSATSSFFPNPLYEEDGLLVRKKSTPRVAVHNNTSPPGNSSNPADASSDVPRSVTKTAGNSSFPTRAPGDARAFPVKPIATARSKPSAHAPSTSQTSLVTQASSTSGASLVTQTTTRSDQASVATRATARSERSALPQSTARPDKPAVVTDLPRNSSSDTNKVNPATPSRRKPLSALTIISEHPTSSSERESPPLDKTTKRRSQGRIRLEKEQQQRRRPRRPKTPVTPQGPRPRPLPPSPNLSTFGTPLPSASGTPSPSAMATTSEHPTRPNSVRRRRPLPSSPQGPRRPSLTAGPHILVPLRRTPHGFAPVLPRSPQIAALMQSHPSSPPSDESSESRPERVFSKQNRYTPTIHTDVEHPASNSTAPVLPPIRPYAPLGTLSGDWKNASSLTVPVEPLRPRSGQPEHTLSMPSSMPSRSTAMLPRGPLPVLPHSARAAPDTPVSSSPRSPRRLPPAPLVLKPEDSGVTAESSKEPSDEAQYLTMPTELQTAPPPYSGRRLGFLPDLKSASSSASFRTAAKRSAAREAMLPKPGPAQKGVSPAPTRHVPRSIPVTPSENSWTSGSTKAYLARTREDSTDDTAAELLFELLGDNESRSSSESSRPLPLSTRRASTVSAASSGRGLPPSKLQSSISEQGLYPALPTSRNARLLDDEERLRTQEEETGRFPQTPRIPPPIPEDEQLPRTPKFPPSPRAPFAIPPSPITPPPPIPTTPGRRRRSKTWNAQGVNLRASGSSSPTVLQKFDSTISSDIRN